MSTTTLPLHEQADTAAIRGDFMSALKFSAEALRLFPLDGHARLKVALCLAAMGKTEDSIATLRIVSETQLRRGFVLSAIGACRDGLGIQLRSPVIMEMLSHIHTRIYGLEGRGRPRVPPPSPPVPAATKDQEGSFMELAGDRLLAEATKLGKTDPDVGRTIKDELTVVPLFSDLSKESFLSLVEHMTFLKVPANHTIVREGDQVGSLYILVQGEVAISRQDHPKGPIAKLSAGSLFGELALIRDKPRTATVTTTQNSELFEIGREMVEKVAASHPVITEDIVQFARRRLVMNLMATSKIFHPFDDAQRLEVLRAFVSRVIERGVTVIADGSQPTGLYLVLEGEVEVSKTDPSGDKVVLAYLHEGEVFGEIALVEKRLTTANVSTTEKSVLFYLDRAKFEAFTRQHPAALEYLSKLSDARREETEGAMSADGVVLEADDLIIL